MYRFLAIFLCLAVIGVADGRGQEKKKERDPAVDLVESILKDLKKQALEFEKSSRKLAFFEPHLRVTNAMLEAFDFAQDRKLFEDEMSHGTVMLLVTSIDQYGDQVTKAQKRDNLAAAQAAADHAERILRHLSKELRARKRNL